MRDGSRNLSHILISRDEKDLIPVFTIGDTDFLVYPKIPAQAVVKLTTTDSTIVGMRDYILSCLALEEQREKFLALMDDIDVEGLGTIVEEIVSRTSPFDSTKRNG